jgi:Zn-finger nucleic acid-binding protein
MAKTDYKCPVCGVGMYLGQAEDVAMLGCGRCGGQWLDQKGTQRVMDGLLSEQARSMARSVSERADDDGPTGGDYRGAQPGARARACPICSGGLGKRTIAGVNIEIDVCERDGTWFDAHELEALAKHFELQAAIVDAEAGMEIRNLAEAESNERRARWGSRVLGGVLGGILSR